MRTAVLLAMLGGAVLGVYLARRGASPAPGGPAPSPAGGQDRICPQVIATCADGSEVPTPCDCAGRGGVARLGGIA
ncbi:VP23 [Thermus phage P23-77]|uniref:VP23 n=1 Tax=Thermus virus P23-77 TaxID=1714272 RepID=C8CHM1_9VIRU|nr:VP23 [Thermus phage P23-77]ACV05050.1 VP23 [Thermus phage P23-77]